jgi:hypothetical protein
MREDVNPYPGCKSLFDARPHLFPLPRGEDILFAGTGLRMAVWPIQSQVFPQTLKRFLLLLGEKAGMREDSKLTFLAPCHCP